jgi:hypothetical protein
VKWTGVVGKYPMTLPSEIVFGCDILEELRLVLYRCTIVMFEDESNEYYLSKR